MVKIDSLRHTFLKTYLRNKQFQTLTVFTVFRSLVYSLEAVLYVCSVNRNILIPIKE